MSVLYVADIRMCMRVCVHVCVCLRIIHAVTCTYEYIYLYRGADGARLKGPFDLEVVFLIFVCVLFSLFPKIFTSMHRKRSRSTTSSARAAWNTCPMLMPSSLATGNLSFGLNPVSSNAFSRYTSEQEP